MSTQSLLVQPVAEYHSLTKALKESPRYPFIVRNCSEFDRSLVSDCIQRLNDKNEALCYGYNKRTGEIIENMKVSQLLYDWDSDVLEVAVLDSPLHIIEFPQSLTQAHTGKTDLGEPLGQTLILSAANSFSPLHMDSPIKGGGFMYLTDGLKDWYILEPNERNIHNVLDKEKKNMIDMMPAQLKETGSDPYYYVQARAGDLIYFPPRMDA